MFHCRVISLRLLVEDLRYQCHSVGGDEGADQAAFTWGPASEPVTEYITVSLEMTTRKQQPEGDFVSLVNTILMFNISTGRGAGGVELFLNRVCQTSINFTTEWLKPEYLFSSSCVYMSSCTGVRTPVVVVSTVRRLNSLYALNCEICLCCTIS